MKPLHLLACLIAFSSMLGGQAAGPCSVEGRVVNSVTGEPVRRVVVTLQRISGQAVRPGEPPWAAMSPAEAETDDQGRFTFRDLDAGGYRITTQRQGFVNPNLAAVNLANSQLWLGEGQQLTGYVVRLTPQAVITGKVLDEYGDPVMGAQVSALRAAGVANGARPIMAGGSVQSNDLGEYRIANLSAGDYMIAAAPPNRNRAPAPPSQDLPDKPQLVYTTTYHPVATGAAEAAVIHVADGAVVAGIDIKLAKIIGFSIRGSIVDPGAPANGPRAFPQLRQRNATVLPGSYFGSSMGGQDGSFQFTGVPPGSYDLFAQRNNIGSPGAVAMAVMPVEVRDRNLDGIVLQMKPSADLQGTVKIAQPGQCDARNMTVSLRPAETGVAYGNVQPGQVGDDLKFTLKSVPATVYSVSVTGPGRCYVKSILYGGQQAPENALAVNGSGPLEITLAPYSARLTVTVLDSEGKPVPRARLTLIPKAGMGTMGSTTGLNGQMNLASMRPGTWEVYAFENAAPPVPQSPDYLRAFESRAKTVTVGESGSATVEVSAIPASETGAATAPPPPPSAKGSLAGELVNAVSGDPLAGATVTLRGQPTQAGPAQAPSVVTDDQGRFAFPDLPPGSYTLTALEQRFIPAGSTPVPSPIRQVIVGEGQQISGFVLKLVPEGVIAGTVKDDAGEPVLGAQVRVFRYRYELGQRRLVAAGSQSTDPSGQYRIVNLNPGDYYVNATRTRRAAMLFRAEPANAPAGEMQPDTIGPAPAEAETDYLPAWYPSASQPTAASAVRLAAGAAVDNIDMTLRKGPVVRIRGKIVDAAGGSAGTTNIMLEPRESPVPADHVGNPVVARDGSFEITGVPPGSYRLIARPGPAGPNMVGTVAMGFVGSSPRMAVRSVEVKDAPIEGIRLEMAAGRTVKGSITMEGGGPVPRSVYVFLTAVEGGNTGFTPNVGGDGKFTIANVFPLTYVVNVQNLPANCYVKAIRYGQDVPRTGLEITGEAELEVVLGVSAAVLEGSVTGADGKPAGNAAIVVEPVSDSWPAKTGNADGKGNFYFANLPPGEYRVIAFDAESPQAADPPESLAAFAALAKTVKLAENAHEKVQVTVVPAGR